MRIVAFDVRLAEEAEMQGPMIESRGDDAAGVEHWQVGILGVRRRASRCGAENA